MVSATKQRGITSTKRLYENVLGNRSAWWGAHVEQVVMLEIAEGVEVEADQDRDDFGIGHHAFPASFRSLRGGGEGMFGHFDFKFFAKIVCNIKNFSNFVFGNHYSNVLFYAPKLLKISEITKRIGSFFKLPIQFYPGISYPELALFVYSEVTLFLR